MLNISLADSHLFGDLHTEHPSWSRRQVGHQVGRQWTAEGEARSGWSWRMGRHRARSAEEAVLPETGEEAAAEHGPWKGRALRGGRLASPDGAGRSRTELCCNGSAELGYGLFVFGARQWL